MNERRILGLCKIEYQKQVNQSYVLIRYPRTVDFCLFTTTFQDDKELSPSSFFSVPDIFKACHEYPKKWPDMLRYYETP